jgi:hypothetical protein
MGAAPMAPDPNAGSTHHMTRLLTLLAIAAGATLAVPAIAAAHPGQRGFERTYPHASRLCAKVANGHTPKRLAGSTDKVTADCSALKTSFTAAQTAYTTATAPLRQQATDAVKALRATCRQAHASHDKAACKTARQQTRATLKSLRGQVRTAGQAYHVAVDGARKTFWTAIRALKGGSSLTPDSTVGPGPTTTLPSDSSVPNA